MTLVCALVVTLVLWPTVKSSKSPITTDLFVKNVNPSECYLIDKVKSRSAVECAILCLRDDNCQTNTFEKSSGDCFLYSEIVSDHGGCCAVFEPRPQPTQGPSEGLSPGPSEGPRNVAQYYTHLTKTSKGEGSTSSSVMLFVEPVQSKLHVFNLRDKTWDSKIIRRLQMVSFVVDRATWRLYWSDGVAYTLVTSDLKGNDRKVILKDVRTRKLALDVKNRRLYFVDYIRKHIGFVNIDNCQRTIVVKMKYFRQPTFNNVHVYPLLRLLYWEDSFKLRRRNYDKNKTEIVPGFVYRCLGFSIDHTHQRLLWIAVMRKTLVWTGLMGEDRIEVKMSEAVLNKPQTYSWNNRIYITDDTTNYVQMYNCRGVLLEKLTWSIQKTYSEDYRSLLFVPEHVYQNVSDNLGVFDWHVGNHQELLCKSDHSN